MEAMTDSVTVMPERDAEGYLIDPSDWNEALAEVLAQD